MKFAQCRKNNENVLFIVHHLRGNLHVTEKQTLAHFVTF